MNQSVGQEIVSYIFIDHYSNANIKLFFIVTTIVAAFTRDVRAFVAIRTRNIVRSCSTTVYSILHYNIVLLVYALYSTSLIGGHIIRAYGAHSTNVVFTRPHAVNYNNIVVLYIF